MTQITISGEVINGRLQHADSLAAFEGQCVVATLTVVPKTCSVNGDAKPPEDADFDPEPPPWLEVEKDLYFPMKVPEILLEKKPLIVERGTPSIILPEELPDE